MASLEMIAVLLPLALSASVIKAMSASDNETTSFSVSSVPVEGVELLSSEQAANAIIAAAEKMICLFMLALLRFSAGSNLNIFSSLVVTYDISIQNC